MDAYFVDDETFPDGTHVQPGTKLVKKWIMKNTGTHPWTSKTKVRLRLYILPVKFLIMGILVMLSNTYCFNVFSFS